MLPLSDQAGLDEFLAQVYDPESPVYHQFLSVQEFTERFGPTAADYDAVVAFAEANGMTIRGTEPANRMVVDVEASVADINRTFHVTMGTYKHPTEDRTFYAPDREPTADLGVQLWHISGLDDFSPPQPMLRFSKPEDVHTFTTGSGPGGTFLGSDIRAAYYGGTALTGAGQTVGLYGLDYNLSDVELYFSSIGQSFNSSQVTNYSTDGTVNTCNSCNDGEPAIDIEQAYSMAPGAKIVEYFGSGDVDTFNAMASANVAKQLSASIGWLPADPTSDEPIFQEFAAQGQSMFVATDDSGAYSSTTPAYYPADDPYVIGVGGTDLTTNGAGGSYASETCWIGSGGGISTDGFAIPSYQQLSGVINSSNGGSTTLRNVPDVSADANTDSYWCSSGTCNEGVGGTSLSTPRWAGFTALANQQGASNGKSPIGFLNPTLYAIGTGSSYDTDFHDITSGNNGDGSGKSYNAVTGYDLCTGWGSPNGLGMINALSGGSTSSGGYNVYGIYTNGTSFTTGGLDNDGYAYSSTELGTSLSWNGSTFTFAAANSADAYSNETITLPSGSYSTLNILATAVNGNQTSQTFTVTYTDGTTTTITQSLSDWDTPQSYSGESIAKAMTYRNTSSGGESTGTFDLYGYSFAINSAKTLKSITLPSNRNVVVLGVVPVAATSGGGSLASGTTYTFTPQNATGLRLDDASSSTATGNTIQVYTANGTGAQNWTASTSGVVPAGYYNFATEGAYCLTASGTASGSKVVLDPCAGTTAQAWEAVASGSYWVFHPGNNTALCLTASGTTSGKAADVNTCSGATSQEWAATVN